MESSSVQGIIPDACSTVCEPEVSRSRNMITIQVFVEHPSDRACAQLVRLYQQSIPLGALQPGDYVLHVNGVTTDFHIG
jgi:hypothetical protein